MSLYTIIAVYTISKHGVIMIQDDQIAIDMALEALERTGSLHVRVVERNVRRERTEIDAVAELTHGDSKYLVVVEFRHNVTGSKLGQIQNQLNRLQEQEGIPCVLVTEYVSASLATKLRDMGIQFADTAGNTYLTSPNLVLSVRGEPRPQALARKERSGRSLQPAGLMLVFKLLCEPDLASSTYRHLAQRSGVSLRTVNMVLDDLKDKGYLLEGTNRNRRLQNCRRLLDEWSVAYRDKLRHQRPVKTFGARDVNWWQDADLKDLPACWTGEVAAAKLSVLRNPQKQTLITWGNLNELIAKHGLRQAENGTIEMIQAWWDTEMEEIAHPILVYADLITSGEERNMQAAEELYRQELAHVLD